MILRLQVMIAFRIIELKIYLNAFLLMLLFAHLHLKIKIQIIAL